PGHGGRATRGPREREGAHPRGRARRPLLLQRERGRPPGRPAGAGRRGRRRARARGERRQPDPCLDRRGAGRQAMSARARLFLAVLAGVVLIVATTATFAAV